VGVGPINGAEVEGCNRVVIKAVARDHNAREGTDEVASRRVVEASQLAVHDAEPVDASNDLDSPAGLVADLQGIVDVAFNEHMRGARMIELKDRFSGNQHCDCEQFHSSAFTNWSDLF